MILFTKYKLIAVYHSILRISYSFVILYYALFWKLSYLLIMLLSVSVAHCTLQIDFSLDTLYNSEKEMQAMMQQILKVTKISTDTEVNQAMLMQLNKDILSNYVEKLVKLVVNNIELSKSAAKTVDKLKTDQIVSQN